jgi:hypothetical protein
MDEAIRAALESRAGSMYSIAKHYFPGLSAKGYAKECPGCQNKDSTFRVYQTGKGNWAWGCYHTSCPLSFDNVRAAKHGDTIGMIMNREGCDRHAAIDILLSMVGIPNPKHDPMFQDDGKKKPRKKPQAAPAAEPSPSPAEETTPAPAPTPAPRAAEPPSTPAPTEVNDHNHEDPGFSLTADPEEPPPVLPPPQPTVWEDLFSRLSLTASDREALKRKRGFTRETIESAGYRSSSGGNRDALAPLLSEYPYGLLLSEGIAVKDTETGKVKINSQLCGWGLVKRGDSNHDDEWGWTNPILIPYRDKDGRCIGIRPHKGGLSGKRYMRKQGFEHAFRSTRTRTHLYTSFLFWHRPEGWERKCVLTEGEHKANALAQCGIPACAVPGIQMPRNEIFAEEMLSILREAGIREVIVAFDNEDKSHKADPWDRYDVEVYALYTCHVLRGNGFLPSHCIIPDEWRDNGKADWDSALAKFGSSAEGKFKAALKRAKPYFPQTEIFATHERDRIVHCKFNRLTLKPQVLTGGDEEEDLAKLILKAPLEWKRRLGIRELAELLFNCRGCYYVHQKPSKELLFGKGRGKQKEPGLYDFSGEIRSELDQIPPEDLEERAGMEAALAAVNMLIKGKPEVLSDFTISCEFQVRTQEGVTHRLFRLRNKHGQVSDLIQVPPDAISTSSKARDFFYGCGNFNLMMGDKDLQKLMIDIGTFSAWREIRELQMLGRDPESNLWIFGDCAIVPNTDMFATREQGAEPEVIFTDKHDVIWYNGIGYRVNPVNLTSFAHVTPPKFFQTLGEESHETLSKIMADPEAERLAVAKIFLQLAADMIATFGDTSGLLVMGATLAYAFAPELLAKYRGHPGIWLHGRLNSGKTETTRFLMMLWGFDQAYKTFVVSGGTTQAFIDRTFAQYSDIPVHADEFRQREASDDLIASLRAPFNRQSKGKARMEQTNRTRLVNPATSPIVTGEGVTKDSATLSRYIEAIIAADKRLGTKQEQINRYKRMCVESLQYHRIVRYILLNRKWFAKEAIAMLDDFVHNDTVTKSIPSDRIRITYGTAYSAFSCLMNHMLQAIGTAQKNNTLGEISISRSDLNLINQKFETFLDFTTGYALRAAEDVISINFVVRFWKDVVTYSHINHAIAKFLWFERCEINEHNKVIPLATTMDIEGAVRCVIVRGPELYAEYQKECRTRGVEPDLILSNIKSECTAEKYWVPAPKTTARQSHRMSREGQGQIDVWVLRCDRMEPALKSIFDAEFDREAKDETEPLGI